MTSVLTNHAIALLNAISEMELPEPVMHSDAHIPKDYDRESVRVEYGLSTRNGTPVDPGTLADNEPLMVHYKEANGKGRVIDILGEELKRCDAQGVVSSYHEYLAGK